VANEPRRLGRRCAALRGRPRLARPKAALTVRVDADALDAFKASGQSWQTRINDLLREAVRRGRV
jgi:uncharacterized protein (DUF4415 family)